MQYSGFESLYLVYVIVMDFDCEMN